MLRQFIILLLIQQAVAQSDSIVLKDNVSLEGDILIHRIFAFSDVENVTIVDYHPENAVLHGIRLFDETYSGKKWKATRLYVGNLSKNQVATVSYQVLEANGNSLLGANTYLIEDERYQLEPQEVLVKVKKNRPVSPQRALFFPFMIIILILISLYLKQQSKRRDMY